MKLNRRWAIFVYLLLLPSLIVAVSIAKEDVTPAAENNLFDVVVHEDGSFDIFWKRTRVFQQCGLFFGTDDGQEQFIPFYDTDGLRILENVDGNVLKITGRIPGTSTSFEQRVRFSGKDIKIIASLTAANWEILRFAELEMFVPSPFLQGERYETGKESGIYPYDLKNVRLIDNTTMIKLAVTQPRRNVQITIDNGSKDNPDTLILTDGRVFSDNFVVIAGFLEDDDPSFTVTISPPSNDADIFEPIVHVSQLGYLPAEEKFVITEEPFGDSNEAAILEKRKGNAWKFVRSLTPDETEQKYGSIFKRFDFTSTNGEGEYRVRYAGGRSVTFSIAKGIYDNLYEATLTRFLPFQMAHIKLNLGDGVKHGLDFRDDGVQVEAGKEGPLGYRSFENTQSEYPEGRHLNINEGGWHDDGDYNDMNVAANAFVLLYLSWATEDFGIDVDETGVTSDGKRLNNKGNEIPDIIEQIRWGVRWMLSMQREDGGTYMGVVIPSMSYANQEVRPHSATDGKRGTGDDREVYTNSAASNQLKFAAAMAAASRVLAAYDQELSDQCLDAAERAWQWYEILPNDFFNTPYNENALDDRIHMALCAALELFVTTGDEAYFEFLKDKGKFIEKLPRRSFGYIHPMRNWNSLPHFIRAYGKLGDFNDEVELAARNWVDKLTKLEKKSVFGTADFEADTWSASGEQLAKGVMHAMIERTFPSIAERGRFVRYLQFTAGLHPGPDYSFILGVGEKFPQNQYAALLATFKPNNSAWIDGGVVQGLSFFEGNAFPEYYDHREMRDMNEALLVSAVMYVYVAAAAEAMVAQ